MMKILLTGAHLTPALAMIDYIQAKHPQDELVFAGRLFSQSKLRQKAVEASEVSQRGVKFIPFQAVKFVGASGLERLWSALVFPRTVRRAKKILRQEEIDVLLSFGSYLAVPFVLAAKKLDIPVVTHEQTISMGRANQLIAKLADKVAISFPQTVYYLSGQDYVVTGNPLRAGLLAKKTTKPAYITQSKPKILLVMGGNQGSFVINELIKDNLNFLLERFVVVHQCGRANKLKDYPQELAQLRRQLPPVLAKRYVVKEWIGEQELFWLYRHAQLAVSRAGANSVLELCLSQLPAILIPLPHSYNQEQELNAQLMASSGGAIILPQQQLKSSVFRDSVVSVAENRTRMSQALQKLDLEQQATAKLYQLLEDVYQNQD